uniref:glucose-1-phosphate adenylyltransferase n=1 Tax=Dunaliella parva TaxID=3048 RepID=K4EKL3_9CHLO|nr:ADP-glucose pyrophosphorylase small subunit [Dunaliella parva]
MLPMQQHRGLLQGQRLPVGKGLLPPSQQRRWSRKAQGVDVQAVQAPQAPEVSQSVAATPVMNIDADINKTVLSIILGGGAGTRLYPLTKKRAKPAVPLGANYRLIDIPVSNCLNSNINKMYCLTQFNSASLNRHLSQAYLSSVGGIHSQGFVEVLAASQSNVNKNWFQGTADAVRQYMWLFEEAVRDGVEDFLILSGDHLYRMDYRDFVRKHKESQAAITIAALPCAEKEATGFGLMKIDGNGVVTDFAEKPKGDALKSMQVDTSVLGVDKETASKRPYIASMGIYVMQAKALKELLLNTFPNANDFGNEVIPGARDIGMKVQAYAFQGYWEDIGTVEAFYNSNLALADPATAQFSFYDRDAPIYTMSRFLPPSKLMDAEVVKSIVGDGCVIKPGTSIKNSIVGIRSLIGADCTIEDSMIMGADYYETLEECEYVPGCMPMGVGDGSIVRRAIIDKNSRVGGKCQIVNKEGVKEANQEGKGWVIKDGIVVIVKDSYIPPGTVI